MKDKFVTYYCENRIGFITMVRAEKRNALNPQLIQELKIAFETAEKDESCKVIVLQAQGQAFCAGADLKYLQSLDLIYLKATGGDYYYVHTPIHLYIFGC